MFIDQIGKWAMNRRCDYGHVVSGYRYCARACPRAAV